MVLDEIKQRLEPVIRPAESRGRGEKLESLPAGSCG
jgi:hypothetical protein